VAIVKVKNKYQVVIPEEARKRLGLRVGDMLEVEEKNGKLMLKPVILVDKSQAYFWSPEWQKGEKEADEDIRKGRLSGPFKNAKELVSHLRKKKK
jgi:AbrB family looped-hinge helix DNA binding protein